MVSLTAVMSRDKLGFKVWTMKELLLYFDLWRNVYESWLMPRLLEVKLMSEFVNDPKHVRVQSAVSPYESTT